MLLGFLEQFGEYVRDGSKTHSMRSVRKHPPKVGEICHCYVNPRQKSMALLGRWPCVKVQDVVIVPELRLDAVYGLNIWIDGERLTPTQVEVFAWNDGFRPYVGKLDISASDLLAQYWAKKKGGFGGHDPCRGVLIHWDYTKPQEYVKHGHHNVVAAGGRGGESQPFELRSENEGRGHSAGGRGCRARRSSRYERSSLSEPLRDVPLFPGRAARPFIRRRRWLLSPLSALSDDPSGERV